MPRAASQRGVSGIIARKTTNTRMATISEPNIQRQLVVPGNQPANTVGDETSTDTHARDDRQLVHEAQSATISRRGHFGDIHGRSDRTQSDPHAADDAEHVERVDVAGQGREHGSDRQQTGSADQRAAAPEPIAQPRPQERADRTAQCGAGRCEPEARLGELELLLQILIGPAHDRQVVAEEKPAHRRDERDGENVARSLSELLTAWFSVSGR